MELSFPCQEGAMGKPTFQGGEIETVWQKQSNRKKKNAKIQRKEARHKAWNNWVNKDMISFWNHGLKSRKDQKFVKRKSKKQLTKGGCSFLLEAKHKSRKGKNVFIGKRSNTGPKEGAISKLDEWHG